MARQSSRRRLQMPDVATDGVRVAMVPTSSLRPSPENDKLYHPIDPDDAEFGELISSIRKGGVRVPLVATEDGFIVSGHRRHAAATIVGLEAVPCQRLSVRHDDDPDSFVKLLREYNHQRVKTFDERVREELVSVDQSGAYGHLLNYRRRKSDISDFLGTAIAMADRRYRRAISRAKRPLLDAVLEVVNACRDYWPLSDRQVHYRLLNNPPLRHASKPGSTYANNLASYKDLCDLLTRARLDGSIEWGTIADETRPFTSWRTWPEPGAFVSEEADGLLRGYWRNLMQSQSNHVEIIAEKLTVKTIIEKVAEEYCIPVTIGRGFCSIQPRYAMAQRFVRSKRDKLVVLVVSDLDPDGEGIAESFARSLRDDFDIDDDRLHAVKVALTPDQVERYRLPPSMKAKSTSARFKSFSQRHGRDAWELEALPPNTLADELRNAIDGVIDREAFEHEREQEAADARRLEATRRAVLSVLPGVIGGDDEQLHHT